MLVKAKDFAAQAPLALPSTAREDNAPRSVEDCFVGLPLAILPEERTGSSYYKDARKMTVEVKTSLKFLLLSC